MYSKFGGQKCTVNLVDCTVNLPELFDKSPNLKEKFIKF
jgi:hypothetical protein